MRFVKIALLALPTICSTFALQEQDHSSFEQTVLSSNGPTSPSNDPTSLLSSLRKSLDNSLFRFMNSMAGSGESVAPASAPGPAPVPVLVPAAGPCICPLSDYYARGDIQLLCGLQSLNLGSSCENFCRQTDVWKINCQNFGDPSRFAQTQTSTPDASAEQPEQTQQAPLDDSQVPSAPLSPSDHFSNEAYTKSDPIILAPHAPKRSMGLDEFLGGGVSYLSSDSNPSDFRFSNLNLRGTTGGAGKPTFTDEHIPRGYCATCIKVIEQVKRGSDLLLGKICADMYKPDFPYQYQFCDEVMRALGMQGSLVRLWLLSGCEKIEIYGEKEWVKPCPSHIICAGLKNLEKKSFCPGVPAEMPFEPPK